MITKYLTAVYKDGARGELTDDGREMHDCWSLTRSARVELYGRKLLGSHGGEYRHDPVGFTERYKIQTDTMRELTEPVPGCFIAVLHKKHLCRHVALVVHDMQRTGLGLHVLEINPEQNARLWPLSRFLEENFLRTIKYYDDPCISEQIRR